MTRSETMVRMGELAASADGEDVLVSLALGSCIGVAMIDRRRGLAGLAHVMLPESPGPAPDKPQRFADLAVPELFERMLALGALRPRIETKIVGGAQMFAFSDGPTAVGPRNEQAVRAELEKLRLPIAAACTGGSAGRTVRVDVATGEVSVKESGGKPWVLA